MFMYIFATLVLGLGWYLVRRWAWSYEKQAVNEIALEQNAKRVYILHTLKMEESVETFEKENRLRLRGHTGYDVEWLFAHDDECVCFVALVYSDKETDIRKMYNEWNSKLDSREKYGFGLQIEIQPVADKSRVEGLEDLSLLRLSITFHTSANDSLLENICQKMKSFMDSIFLRGIISHER